MITGYNGVNAPKGDPSIAGSTITYLAANSALPVFVIKDTRRREVKPDNLFRYAVCYDGSPQAFVALELVIKMIGKQDRMTTVTVKEMGIDDVAVKDMVTKLLAESGHSGQYEHISIEHSQTETIFNTIK